jgi:glutamate--cysteine ligase
LENPKSKTQYQAEGQVFLDQLQDFGATIHWGPEYQEVLEMMQNRLDNTNLTPSANLTDHIQNGSLVPYALQIGARYQNRAHRNPNPFKGFADNPEMPVTELKQKLFDKSNQPVEYKE